MDSEPLWVELLLAVGTGGFAGLGVPPEFALDDAVGREDHISILELLFRGGPLAAVVDHDLHVKKKVDLRKTCSV